MKDTIVRIFTSETLWTLVSGVSVFALSQYLMEIWIKPLQQYKELKYDVVKLLVIYAPEYGNPLQWEKGSGEMRANYDRVSEETRNCAAELKVYIELMPKLHPGIPKSKQLAEAAGELIGLSNSMYLPHGVHDSVLDDRNLERIRRIMKCIRTKYVDSWNSKELIHTRQ